MGEFEEDPSNRKLLEGFIVDRRIENSHIRLRALAGTPEFAQAFQEEFNQNPQEALDEAMQEERESGTAELFIGNKVWTDLVCKLDRRLIDKDQEERSDEIHEAIEARRHDILRGTADTQGTPSHQEEKAQLIYLIAKSIGIDLPILDQAEIPYTPEEEGFKTLNLPKLRADIERKLTHYRDNKSVYWNRTRHKETDIDILFNDILAIIREEKPVI
jgi:hypothetical protein